VKISQKSYEEFKDLIDTCSEETLLQEFLQKCPEIIIHAFEAGAHLSTVFPKFRLADELFPDFVMIGHRSSWSWNVDLIEIEPAVLKEPLFTQNNLSTGRLRIAESQITKWQVWMNAKEDFFVQRALEKLKEVGAWDKIPKFYNLSNGNSQSMLVMYRIVIGRRKDFEGWGTKYQNITWEESGHRREIVPWDRLLEKTKLWADTT
jgi:hypothetical protein